MENAANGILFSTSTGHSEIDELNRILTVERELVLKTQENYRSLKGKYLELSEENELLKKELAILRQDYSEQGSFKENFVSLEAKSRHLIKQMAADNEAREMRYEKFRTDTLSELQKVFRKV
ncbi:unnamed protein product [Caenorhabditis auriculariae]|uniref:Uncharacterized protein n=1 Tax=Caenorhabditis auriculariae TaxID=2777116 RepID=A0A8S1HAT6_9PELO|nr:unnamed protein product [Caenorhabditis auriculariae]